MTEKRIYRRNFILHLQERPDFSQAVLLKEPAHQRLTDAQVGQLHNEYAISRQLDDVAGVRPAYTLVGSESHPVLLLKYIQGENLAETARKQSLELPEKLRLAVEISAILGRIHDAGVMHRDISSSNIMVADNALPDGSDRVTIIDFGLATSLRQDELAQPIVPDVVAGTLAYISPEQTGRMNRAIDYRSDLYSLGVTLYELFTGQLPFQTGDGMEMIHAHIAIQPIPLHEHNDEIPEIVSEIILKLMAKNAEDRYQSARGLSADLDKCLDQLQRTGSIETFELGQDDFSGRLQISQKLYGREAEIKQLLDSYDRAAQGNPELLYIAGYSGVGKTALVHEMRREVLMRQGIFIEGKFDQLQRTLPYSAWEQAFTQLANNWLAESESKLEYWRETILEAVGENGQVLIDVIPALERIIGPQPEVPQLGGLENQNRFNYTFNRFISGLATPESPLVVFLDDLQWIDPASLGLIEALMAVQSKSSLLVLGAYRDNEVGADHPLAASQDRMTSDVNQVNTITLADLKPADVDQLLADSLRLPVAEFCDLSQILQEKTAGNPFFFRQQLYALESEELLFFDRSRRRWTWEADLQQSLQAGGNVVDLMVRKIQTLPTETQETLSMAACLGNRFEIVTLNTVSGQGQSDILTSLSPALQDGLINRSNGYFSFVHDRIQEAGYALVPEEERPQIHLEIGRLLLENVTDEKLDEEIFTIVSNLNAGRVLIDTDSEKVELARLNLKAGQRAKAAAAFVDAKQYIEIGIDLLGPDSWKELYTLTLSLHNENGELAALTGQYDQVETTGSLIHANAKNILDQVPIYMITIEAKTVQYNFPEALEIGLNVLRQLEVDIPEQPDQDDYQNLNVHLVDLLSNVSLESIPDLPEMTDDRAVAISFILASEMSTAYIVDPALSVIIQYLGAIYSLEYGLNAWSPFFFGVIALLNIGTVNHEIPPDVAAQQIRFANQLVGIVREMLKNPITVRGQTKALQSLAVATPWLEPIEKGIEAAEATILSSFETGDLMYGAYGVLHYAMQGFAADTNLDTYQTKLSNYLALLQRTGQVATIQWALIYLQAVQNFKELVPEPDKLNGTYLDQDEWLPRARAANDVNGLHFYSILRLALSYHFDLDNKLEQCIEDVEEEHLAHVPTNFSTATAYFYLPLARLRLIRGNNKEDHAEPMNLINNGLQLLMHWSKSVPSTFQHQVDLLSAEKASISGDLDGALVHYEQAINGARENGFTHVEALANELFARFWAERGNERFASQFMREAHSLYRKWGAMAKAEHLQKRYPNWLVSKRITPADSGAGTTTGRISENLDLFTVLKASQAIAGEIEMDRLLAFLMSYTIENSGAQFGYLLLPEDGRWVISAQAGLETAESDARQPIGIVEDKKLAQRIVQYVARTQHAVLLEDAAKEGDFVDDPHVQAHEVKSLLCTPLVNQGKTSAILYLENNLTPGVFSPDRLELLQLLSAQMAISIDNARTHDRLEQLLEERSRALDSAQARFRMLFENAPIGIALSTFGGDILTVNQALLNMLRISEEEVRQQRAVVFYANPKNRDTLMSELQKSGSVYEFGINLQRYDGEYFYGSVSLNRLTLEGEEIILVIVEDVSDQIIVEQQAAALEERERLARELHDAVSQTLFSAGMIADATPTLWEKDPATGRQNMEMLSTMIRGASAEMRSLLLELRPDTLRDQTLGMLLETLAVAARARSQAEVSLNIEGDCQLAEDVTLALHRIAQESLNNIAKHAQAGAIQIDLRCNPEAVTLRIKDDGRGFDPQTIPSGHLGIGIMRERAHRIGATIEIDSKPGAGTSVMVSWVEEVRGMEQ